MQLSTVSIVKNEKKKSGACTKWYRALVQQVNRDCLGQTLIMCIIWLADYTRVFPSVCMRFPLCQILIYVAEWGLYHLVLCPSSSLNDTYFVTVILSLKSFIFFSQDKHTFNFNSSV